MIGMVVGIVVVRIVTMHVDRPTNVNMLTLRTPVRRYFLVSVRTGRKNRLVRDQ